MVIIILRTVPSLPAEKSFLMRQDAKTAPLGLDSNPPDLIGQRLETALRRSSGGTGQSPSGKD